MGRSRLDLVAGETLHVTMPPPSSYGTLVDSLRSARIPISEPNVAQPSSTTSNVPGEGKAPTAGDLIPLLTVNRDELDHLGLDEKSVVVLCSMDGVCASSEIAECHGLSADDMLCLVQTLEKRGIVRLVQGP